MLVVGGGVCGGGGGGGGGWVWGGCGWAGCGVVLWFVSGGGGLCRVPTIKGKKFPTKLVGISKTEKERHQKHPVGRLATNSI